MQAENQMAAITERLSTQIDEADKVYEAAEKNAERAHNIAYSLRVLLEDVEELQEVAAGQNIDSKPLNDHHIR